MKKKITILMLALIVCINYYTIAFAKNKVENFSVYSIKYVLYVDYKKAAESFDLKELEKIVYKNEDEKKLKTNAVIKEELVSDKTLMVPNTALISNIKKYKVVDKMDEKSCNIYRKKYVNGMLYSSDIVTSKGTSTHDKTYFVKPTNGGVITSEFGERWGRLHEGIDIGLNYGDDIYAARDGVVISAGYEGAYGYSVLIDHGEGVHTLYAHNSELIVSEGQRVKAGDVIASAGSTGSSTGVHVHFEVRLNDKVTDPLKYVKY